MDEIKDLKERIYNFIEIMCITENSEELNITFDRASNLLAELYDKNFLRIKR